MNRSKIIIALLFVMALSSSLFSSSINSGNEPVATFSIVGYDPATGEVGVAVASKFFTVGNVVPWAKAGVGAVATQSFCNTTFGWRGLDLMERGMTPDEIKAMFIRTDEGIDSRQFGIVDVSGNSATFTGEGCLDWAGGRSGPNYAVQGNILAGEDVVIAMEKTFLETKGTLAERLYAALLAGEANGGDSRGKQSAALLVVKENAGYGGFTDRAIDIRVDDHVEPFKELGRILKIAQMNYLWNVAWTAFSEGNFAEALEPMEKTAKLAPEYGEVLYDLAVIRLANDDIDGALTALTDALKLNPKLKAQATVDDDMEKLHDNETYMKLIE